MHSTLYKEVAFPPHPRTHCHRPVDVEGVDDDDLLFEIHFITGPNDFVPILAGAKHVAAALNVHYIAYNIVNYRTGGRRL